MEFAIIHLNEKKNQIVIRKFIDFEGIKNYVKENQIPDNEYSIVTGNQLALFK